MSETLFRFTEIEYGNSPTDEKIVGVFRFEQSSANRTGPQQVVVAEVYSTLYAYERLLDLISTTIEQSRALTSGMTLDPFARFEKLVQRLNEAVASFQEKEPTPIHWNRVNIFLIECSQNQLCLSGHGRLMNMFLQKKTEGGYQVFDLCASLEQSENVDPKKIFSSVICGDMKPGDMLFIGSTSFERLRDNLDIKNRLSSLPPVSASLEIKQDLEKLRTPDDFAAVLISCHNAAEKPAPVAPPKGAQASMRELHQNELQTNQTLAPVLNPVKSTKPALTTDAVPKPPKPAANVSDFWQKIKGILPKRHKPTVATTTTMRGLDAGHATIFTTKRKVMLGAALIAILAVGIGYTTYSRNKAQAAERASWEQKFSQAQDFRNRAESSLVYAKDTQTKSEVQQSEALLSALDTSTEDRKTKVEGLKSELNQIKERLRKAYVASSAVELYSLPVTAADGSLTAPIMTEKSAFVADDSERQIIKLDLASKSVKTIPLPQGTSRIVAGSIGEKSLVYLDDKGQFVALNLEDDKIQLLNKFAQTSSTSITDFAIYNKRAYVLDGAKGQITRLNKTATGFGSPSVYVQSSVVPLAGSIGLAIDSNVFVAKADGGVVRLLSGKQEPFSLSQIDPQIQAISDIWTEMDDPRIMMADPADKRLLIFDKNGLLTAQVTSPEFNSLRSVSGRLGQKNALVISNNRLLLVALP